jgi:hypothetical protein
MGIVDQLDANSLMPASRRELVDEN